MAEKSVGLSDFFSLDKFNFLHLFSPHFSSSSSYILIFSVSVLSITLWFSLLYLSTMSSMQHHSSVHEFSVKNIKGEDVNLSSYQGKVLLIVNVASHCKLSNKNYSELNELYDRYRNQGLEILAFPCNQFGKQEPGSNEEILEATCSRFKAEFPVFDKIKVNGENAHPLYKYMKSCKGGFLVDGIKWNFSKFLVDQDGHVIERFVPTTSPLHLEKNIKQALGIA